MRTMQYLTSLRSGFVFLFLLVGCATTNDDALVPPVERIQSAESVPEDFQRKFEIEEAEPKTPQIEAAASLDKKTEVAKEPKKEEEAKAKKPDPKKAKLEVKIPKGFKFPNRRPEKDPIWIGEKQVLDVTFYGMLAGTFTFEVKPHKQISNRKSYHLHGHAKTSRLFAIFYTLDDRVDSFWDYEGLFSHRFQLDFNESDQSRNSVELHDSVKGQTFYWDKVNHKKKGLREKKEVHPMAPFPQDMISFLYYLRMVPLPDGAVVKFPMVTEGKVFEGEVTVVRREYLKTPLGRVRTVVVKPATKFQGRLTSKGESFVWLTDDDRRFIARVEARVKIGTVKANLKEVELGTPPK